jgi:hypothetical protein
MEQMYTCRGSKVANGNARLGLIAAAILMLFAALPGWAAAPAGYLETDIGSPANKGSVTVDANGVWTVLGEGNRFEQVTADQLHFVYKSIKGNGSIIARNLEQSQPGSQYVGVMVRASLDANSVFVGGIMSTTSNAINFLRRLVTGELGTRDTVDTPDPAYPKWMMLTRTGNVLQDFYSADGRIWLPLQPTVTLTLPETAVFGIAVSSRSAGVLTTAKLDNIAILEGVVPPTGVESAATKNLAFLAWDPITTATGYAIYRGVKDATPDKLTLIKTVAAPAEYFVDDSVTTDAKKDLQYLITGVFKAADGKLFEGPAVRAR